MQLQGHPESRDNNFVQQVDVCEHPLISGCYPEVTFEEGMEAIGKNPGCETKFVCSHGAKVFRLLSP